MIGETAVMVERNADPNGNEGDESSELPVLQRFVAARGRALLDVFGAHGVDIVEEPPGLVFHLDGDPVDPALALPTSFSVTDAASASIVKVNCESADSPQASPE